MRVAVVGAGPAGLMAAAEAACGNDVVLFDRNDRPGKKLYITGKGRCNFTNACEPREFLENVVTNPRFLYGAINSFTPADAIELIESMGVRTKVERGARAFPASDKASDVTKALFSHASGRGVRFVSEDVRAVERSGGGFTLTTDKGSREFDRVVLACGGITYPSTGSNGDGYELARKLGHTIVSPIPALTQIFLREDVTELHKLTLKNVRVTVTGARRELSLFGETEFTDRGVAGPLPLTVSSYICRESDFSRIKMYVDLKPALDHDKLDKRILNDFSKQKNKQFKNSLGELLPKSMISYIIKASGIDPDKQVNSITRAERERLCSLLKALPFSVTGTGGAAEAIVTSGGVAVGEVDPRTMESKKVGGLYFAGEMLDVDALTGGFNIQIALSTGCAAGRAIAKVAAAIQ